MYENPKKKKITSEIVHVFGLIFNIVGVKPEADMNRILSDR